MSINNDYTSINIGDSSVKLTAIWRQKKPPHLGAGFTNN